MTFREAAKNLRTEQVIATASRSEEYDGDEVKGPKRIRYGGVQFAEVSVDTEIGLVLVEQIVAVQDCGRPMNPIGSKARSTAGFSRAFPGRSTRTGISTRRAG